MTAGLLTFLVYVVFLDRKLDNLERTGANVLVTSCPACLMQLGWGCRERGEGLAVRHIAELLAERQGLELGD